MLQFRGIVSRKPAREPLVIVGVYVTLTVLVWGLFAFSRGTWQDEVMVLHAIQLRAGDPLGQLITPRTDLTTRWLSGIPYAFAQWSGRPVFALQSLYGLTWLSMGVLVHLLAHRLFPQHDWLAYFAGAVTLCATGDFALNYVGTITHLMSAASYFASVLCLLGWWEGSGRRWLWLAGISLSLSLGLYESALAAALLTPGLLWALDQFRLTRRLAKVAILWYALIAPYVIAFGALLFRPGAYARYALQPMAFAERLERTMLLFTNNFTPWVWALSRRQWSPALAPVVPSAVRLALTLAGTTVFLAVGLWLGRRLPNATVWPARQNYRFAVVGATCLVMALASSASFASVHLSEFFFRTQLVSGVWASLGVSLLGYWLGPFALRRPYLALVLPTIFVGFGVYGGVERQDYYLAYWQQHRAELRSIVEQVPGLQEDATLILYVPPGSPYLATEASYLARAWLIYLHGDPSLAPRVFLWSSDRNTSCVANTHGFVCEREPQDCLYRRDCMPETIPYDRMVLLIYSPAQNRYLLQCSIPSALLGNTVFPPTNYNPQAQIVDRPLPAYAQTLLYGPQFLGILFTGERPPAGPPLATESPAAIVGIENPNGIEEAPNGEQFFWIGQGDTAINVASSRPGIVLLQAYFVPGPSLPDTNIRRLLFWTDAGYRSEELLTSEGDAAISVPVVSGTTRILVTPVDKPTARLPSDPRPLLVGVAGLHVGGFSDSQ